MAIIIGTMAYFKALIILASISAVVGKPCPGGQFQCPDSTTCCKLSDGSYGCCPMPNAVCCSDHQHCCPQNTQCDVRHSRCLKSDGNHMPWSPKARAEPNMEEESGEERSNGVEVNSRQQCFHSETTCPTGSTCCRSRNGATCCPFVNGVCCSDQIHCCPQGTHCDTERRRCIVEEAYNIGWSRVFLGNTLAEARAQEQQCDDGSHCPTPGTCCRKRYGLQYMCCGLPNAVCCGTHCCPQGFRCGRGGGHHCLRDADMRPELKAIDNLLLKPNIFK